MVGLALLLRHDRVPLYRSRPLTYWLTLTRAPGTLVQEQGADAIRRIGTNSIPILLDRIGYDCPRWRTWLGRQKFEAHTKSWGRWIPIWTTSFPAMERVLEAVEAFGALGPAASPAIPRLLALTKDSNERAQFAVQALANIGPDATSALLEVVADPGANRNARARATSAIAGANASIAAIEKLRSMTPRAVAVFIRNLQDADEFVAGLAANALGILKSLPESSVPALTQALEQPRRFVRERATKALERFEHDATPAVPALTRALADPVIEVRKGATNALLTIAPEVLTNTPATQSRLKP